MTQPVKKLRDQWERGTQAIKRINITNSDDFIIICLLTGGLYRVLLYYKSKKVWFVSCDLESGCAFDAIETVANIVK